VISKFPDLGQIYSLSRDLDQS